jgi:hypothetical protein
VAYTYSAVAGTHLYRVVGVVGGIEVYAECSVDAGPPYRLNCGGRPHIDGHNRPWIPDELFVTNLEHTSESFDVTPVANTEEESLFQSERWLSGQAGEGIYYAFPIDMLEPGTTCAVELYFDEMCVDCRTDIGPDGIPGTIDDDGFGRTFNVAIEGRMVLVGFQPAVEASFEAGRRLPGGEAFIAIQRSFLSSDVNGNGTLDIHLYDIGGGNPPGNPKISAMAVSEGRIGILTGDFNGDDKVDIADPIGLLRYLFRNGRRSACEKAADANNNGELEIADGIRILSFLFDGQPLEAPDGSRIGPDDSFCKSYSLSEIGELGCTAPCAF